MRKGQPSTLLAKSSLFPTPWCKPPMYMPVFVCFSGLWFLHCYKLLVTYKFKEIDASSKFGNHDSKMLKIEGDIPFWKLPNFNFTAVFGLCCKNCHPAHLVSSFYPEFTKKFIFMDMSYTTVTDNEQTIKSYRTLYLVEPVSFLSSAAAVAFCKTSSYLSSKANYESKQ